ncbi:MAG: Ham1 family protein [Parcubacteria group bacterium Athens0714_16]|nr:MAG: Ham1 family protein [Parcubacteria group bacterium Athens0714_16]
MKTLIIGTQNQAKVKQIAGALFELPITVEGLPYKICDVEENGLTPQENAKIKAKHYSKSLNRIVLSMDNALYLDGLSDEEQPKMNVRRILGRTDRPTDDELLKHYISVVDKLGGKINGRWEFAICIADNGKILKGTTIVSPRIFVSKPSNNIVNGYPLESIQIDPETEVYISEMSQEEQDKFWQKVIGKQLCEFVQSIL